MTLSDSFSMSCCVRLMYSPHKKVWFYRRSRPTKKLGPCCTDNIARLCDRVVLRHVLAGFFPTIVSCFCCEHCISYTMRWDYEICGPHTIVNLFTNIPSCYSQPFCFILMIRKPVGLKSSVKCSNCDKENREG